MRYKDCLDNNDFVIPRVKGGFKGDWQDPITISYTLPPVEYTTKKKVRRSSLHGPVNTLESGSISGGSGAQQRPSRILMATAGIGLFPPRNTVYGGNKGGGDNFETESVMSDATDATDISTISKIGRKSVTTGFSEMFFKNPSSLQTPAEIPITSDLLEYRPDESLDWHDIVVLKHYSIEKPDVLIGWQITKFYTNGIGGELSYCHMISILCLNCVSLRSCQAILS
jgi:hypothetical protein